MPRSRSGSLGEAKAATLVDVLPRPETSASRERDRARSSIGDRPSSRSALVTPESGSTTTKRGFKEKKKGGKYIEKEGSVKATWAFIGRTVDVDCPYACELLSKSENDYQASNDSNTRREARKALRINYEQFMKAKQYEEGKARDLVQRMVAYFDTIRLISVPIALIMFYFAANKPPEYEDVDNQFYGPSVRRNLFGLSIALSFFCALFALLLASVFSSYINFLGASGVTWFAKRYGRLLDAPELLLTLSLLSVLAGFVNNISAHFTASYIQYCTFALLALVLLYLCTYAVMHRGVVLRVYEINKISRKDRETESLVFSNTIPEPNPPASARSVTPVGAPPPTASSGNVTLKVQVGAGIGVDAKKSS